MAVRGFNPLRKPYLENSLTNGSGAAVSSGTVVGNFPGEDSFDTMGGTAFGGTTDTFIMGVTLEDIPNGGIGQVAFVGEVERVLVDSGATGGLFLAISTTTGQAVEVPNDRDGVFGISLSARAADGTCRAILFGKMTRLAFTGAIGTTGAVPAAADKAIPTLISGGTNPNPENSATDNYIAHVRRSTYFSNEGFFETPGTLNGVTLATVDYQVRLGAAGTLVNVFGITQAGNVLGLGDYLAGGNLTFRSGTSFTGTFDHAITAARTWTLPDTTGTIGLLSTVAPVGADYLVGTADGTLTGEIVVGTTPGGELGNTWASPTVDTTHSGSSHAALPTQGANLDMGNNLIVNIGAAGTDFTAGGGLTLAGRLAVYTAGDDTAVPLSVNSNSGTPGRIVARLNSQVSGGASFLQFTDGFTYNYGFGTEATSGDLAWYSGRTPATAGTLRMSLSQAGLLTVLNGLTVSAGGAAITGATTITVAGGGDILNIVSTAVDSYAEFNLTNDAQTWRISTAGGEGDGLRFYDITGGAQGMMLTTARQLQLPATGSSAGLLIGGDVQLYRGAADTFEMPNGDMLRIGGSASRSTTQGTNHLDIFNGTAPVGNLTNGISLYAAAGELWVLDATNNPTQLSPHDADGYWVFKSRSGQTGRMFQVDMERMIRALNAHFGWDFIHDLLEEVA